MVEDEEHDKPAHPLGRNTQPGFVAKMEHIRDFLRGRLEIVLGPVANGLLRLRVTPNQVSVVGVLLNLLTAALIVADALVPAGVAYLAAGAMDLLDGVLARRAKAASSFGAFLDSTLDRVSEGLVFAAIAYRFALQGDAVDVSLVVMALLGSLLVSYTRARAEGLGAQCKVGIVTRAERIVLIALGLLLDLLPHAIYALVALTAFTVSQRIVHTFRQLAAERYRGAG